MNLSLKIVFNRTLPIFSYLMYSESNPDICKQNKTQNPLGKNKFFDHKMGMLGGAVMGSIVYYINSEYGFDAASIAAAKQATYTFFIGGATMKLSENLSVKYENKLLSRTASVLIPATLSIGLTLLLHTAKGTPEPLYSTIPTIVLSPIGFVWWGNKKRKELEKLLQEQVNKRDSNSSQF